MDPRQMQTVLYAKPLKRLRGRGASLAPTGKQDAVRQWNRKMVTLLSWVQQAAPPDRKGEVAIDSVCRHFTRTRGIMAEADEISHHEAYLYCVHDQPEDFRDAGHAMVDWIADYRSKASSFPVRSSVKPGYLAAMLVRGGVYRIESNRIKSNSSLFTTCKHFISSYSSELTLAPSNYRIYRSRESVPRRASRGPTLWRTLTAASCPG